MIISQVVRVKAFYPLKLLSIYMIWSIILVILNSMYKLKLSYNRISVFMAFIH